MRSPHELLDERDSLRAPVLKSLFLHMALFATVTGFAHMNGTARDLFGDPNSLGGGSVAIQPVSTIPLVRSQGRENPLARDTESQVPAAPKPEAKPVQKEDPEAIAIKGRQKKAARQQVARAQNLPPRPLNPNQVYSSAGAGASSPLYGGPMGSGGVGLSSGNPFGNRFGYYAQILRERVAQRWNLSQVDPRITSAPPVIVVFELNRDGSVRNLRLLQRSGIPALDYACQRAIADASPFPALPSGFERDSANIEFWFQLKR